MSIFEKIRNRLLHKVSRTLIYDEALQLAYSTTSICGGTLRGKTAVVTGATSGIGFATAQRLLSEGCKVIIVGRNKEKLRDCIAQFVSGENVEIEYMVFDAQDTESFKEKIETVFKNHTIDLWVNCVGIFKTTDRERIFRGIDKETYFEVVNTNLKSNMILIPYVADEMLAHGIVGKIITVSSICGFTNHYGYTPYGISKNGLIEYTKQIAEKYKGRVSILSVAPGSVATRMGHSGLGKNIFNISSFIHHTAIPEEIASVIVFLSTSIGIYLNGQTILASAGELV